MGKLVKILIIILALFYGGFLLIQNATGLRKSINFLAESSEEINFLIKEPCGQPVKYSLGQIDSQFNLSAEELKSLTTEAEELWENSVTHNLFEYDATAPFKINLIFDTRQQQTIDSEKLGEELKNLETKREALIKQYGSLNNAYVEKLAEYKKERIAYEAKLKKYNKNVAYWNNRGGAPKDEYADLEKERKKLKELANSLEKQRLEVNSLATQTNQIVKKENQVIFEYNTNVATYENKYGESQEFEKGVFDGNGINIYQYKEKDDLRLTLIHELGHALGLGHLENPQAIMYYLMGEQEMENPALTPEDLQELNKVCQF